MRKELELVAPPPGPSDELHRARRKALIQSPKVGVHCRSKSRSGSRSCPLSIKVGLQHQASIWVPIRIDGGRLGTIVATWWVGWRCASILRTWGGMTGI